MAWTEIALNTDGINTIYGGEIPALDKISLHEIRIGRDGPEVHLRCDLSRFPTSPPRKWKSAGYNRVQIELVASGVKEFRISGDFANSECSINVAKDDQPVTLSYSGVHLDLYVSSRFLRIDRISAYCDSDRP